VGLLTDAQGNGLLVSSLRHGTTMTVKVIGPSRRPHRDVLLWAYRRQGLPLYWVRCP
jgi:hypothetical protein